jgi:hypothetical protein
MDGALAIRCSVQYKGVHDGFGSSNYSLTRNATRYMIPT